MTSPAPSPSPAEQAALRALHTLAERARQAFGDLPSTLGEGSVAGGGPAGPGGALAGGHHAAQGRSAPERFTERVEAAFARLYAEIDAVRGAPGLPAGAVRVLEHLEGEVVRRHAVVDYLTGQLEYALGAVEEDVQEAVAWYEHDLYGEDGPPDEPGG